MACFVCTLTALLLSTATVDAKKPPKAEAPEQAQSEHDAPDAGQNKAPKVKATKPPRKQKPAGEPDEPGKTKEEKQQQKLEKQIKKDQQKLEKQLSQAQKQSAKQEAKNKKKEGNKESPPAPAPAGTNAGQPATPTLVTSTPAGGSGSNGSGNNGRQNTQRGSGDNPNNDGKKNGSNNRSNGNAGGEGGSQGGGGAGTPALTAAGVAGAAGAVDATGDPSADNDNDGGSNGDDGTSDEPPTTVVERVIHEIPTAYQVALGALLALVALLSGISVRERRRSTRTERDMLVDGLTGVGSRKALNRELDTEWKRSERHDRPLGLLLLDLDDLKEINDSFGHAAGDELLRSAGRSISDRVRQSDMVARLGGDEFVVVCPETSETGLEQLAIALQQDFKRLKVGVSVGYAERSPLDRGPDDLMARADQAMYAQKRAGAVG